jgi:hypothetical protein
MPVNELSGSLASSSRSSHRAGHRFTVFACRWPEIMDPRGTLTAFFRYLL